jgi:hypothetical protein
MHFFILILSPCLLLDFAGAFLQHSADRHFRPVTDAGPARGILGKLKGWITRLIQRCERIPTNWVGMFRKEEARGWLDEWISGSMDHG